MDKGKLEIDPRGLIFESYRIDGIRIEECRSIFLDWALGVPMGDDLQAALRELKAVYADKAPDHPMSAIIRDGLQKASPTGRRRGRSRG